MGYKIFSLCLRQVLNNWLMTLRIGWFWLLTVFLVGFAFGLLGWISGGMNMAGRSGVLSTISLLVVFVAMFTVIIIATSTIAIAWHRFILLDETPENFYVLHREWPIGKYFWTSFKIILLIMLMAIPAILILSFIAGSFMGSSLGPSVRGGMGMPEITLTSLLLSLLLTTLLSWVFLRVGAVLPAIAVGKNLSLREAFRLTGAISGSLFVAAFFVAVVSLLPNTLELLLKLSVGPGSFLSMLVAPVLAAVFHWISFFVSIGILTVVYGHLVEDRPI